MNAMRWAVSILAVAALVCATGCAKTKPAVTHTSPATSTPRGTAPPPTDNRKVIVTPAAGLSGKVAAVNQAGQFVVLTFTGAEMPVLEQKLSVYRGGLKVGEVKVSKEQMGRNLVADIVAGEAKQGDEVRPE
jgi:hypothetical protein